MASALGNQSSAAALAALRNRSAAAAALDDKFRRVVEDILARDPGDCHCRLTTLRVLHARGARPYMYYHDGRIGIINRAWISNHLALVLFFLGAGWSTHDLKHTVIPRMHGRRLNAMDERMLLGVATYTANRNLQIERCDDYGAPEVYRAEEFGGYGTRRATYRWIEFAIRRSPASLVLALHRAGQTLIGVDITLHINVRRSASNGVSAVALQGADGATAHQSTNILEVSLRELLKTELWCEKVAPLVTLLRGLGACRASDVARPSTPLERFRSSNIYDENVLGMVLGFVTGREHRVDFTKKRRLCAATSLVKHE